MTLAKKLGVIFKFETEVQSIITRSKQVEGVKTKNEEIKAECIISNGGATETYRNLLSKRDRSYFITKRMQHLEPSCSGLVLLLGINKKYEQLSHHNIFFSKNYKKEFDAIFNQKKMPDAPTIYIANTSATNPNHAPAGGSNLFVLINAPYLSKNWSWQDKAEPYSNFVINALEKRGLDGLRDSIIYQRRITPVDFYERYKSNKGSIYGTSSNSRMAAFVRPKNKVRDVDGLYMVGGSTHPGGGIPLVIQSAFNAVELIKRYE
jgi:phytoene desaturase